MELREDGVRVGTCSKECRRSDRELHCVPSLLQRDRSRCAVAGLCRAMAMLQFCFFHIEHGGCRCGREIAPNTACVRLVDVPPLDLLFRSFNIVEAIGTRVWGFHHVLDEKCSIIADVHHVLDDGTSQWRNNNSVSASAPA